MISRMFKALFLSLLAMTMFACQTDLKSGQTQNEADRIIVALQRHGIKAGKKEISKNRDTSYTVTVSKTKIDEARRILIILGLPREKVKGIEEICGAEESLIPSPSIDRCKYQLAVQNEVTKAILTIDGVVEAKVNIVMPDDNVLNENASVRPTAAVLVKYIPDKAGKAPFEEKKVREFVANSVDNLDYNDVTILATMSRRVDLKMIEKKRDEMELANGTKKEEKETKSKEKLPVAKAEKDLNQSPTFMGSPMASDAAKKLKVITLFITVLVLLLSGGMIATFVHLKSVKASNERLKKRQRRMRLQAQRALQPGTPSLTNQEPAPSNNAAPQGAQEELLAQDNIYANPSEQQSAQGPMGVN